MPISKAKKLSLEQEALAAPAKTAPPTRKLAVKPKSAAPAATAAATHKAPARAKRAKPAATVFDPEANHAEISREAYLLYLNRGGNHGAAQDDWFRAIEIVRSRYSAV
jgi:hypothetical protein